MKGNLPAVMGVISFLLVLVGVPIWFVVLSVLRRQMAEVDRRRIYGNGGATQGIVTKISTPSRQGGCSVQLEYSPESSNRTYHVTQRTTEAAIQKVGLSVGSVISIRYRTNKPSQAFAHDLVVAERSLSLGSGSANASTQLFYITFFAKNGFNWTGPGDVTVSDSSVIFHAAQSRSFWFPKPVQPEVVLSNILDVDLAEDRVHCAISGVDGKLRRLQFLASDSAAAAALCRRLPTAKSTDFVEASSYKAALSQLPPGTPVTFGIILANVVVFAIEVALGGGFLVPNAEVMIRLGTDYTPLTLGGQWWRLFTSIFLHFGLIHIGFNMWALFNNGRLVERIFGPLRYLFIYIASGLFASVVSLLWHPVLNGAGASGAIFGILGAMMAFFVRREPGIPSSVAKSQLRNAGIYVAYAILTAASLAGIDNAAHLGGLFAGFVLGLILAQPVDAQARSAKSQWTPWSLALGLTGVTAGLLAFFLVTGKLTPRTAYDQNGREIPREALGPPLRVLWGIRLGMTPEQLTAMKGAPLVNRPSSWVYHTVDASHDGVISAYFSPAKDNQPQVVSVLEFIGRDPTSAPTEMPFWIASSPDDVIRKYGDPDDQHEDTSGIHFMFFRNGAFIAVEHGRITRYGITNSKKRS